MVQSIYSVKEPWINVHYNFSEPKLTSSHCLFCPQSKDVQVSKQRNTTKPHIWKVRTSECWSFLPKTWWQRWNRYWNSCRLSCCQITNWFIKWYNNTCLIEHVMWRTHHDLKSQKCSTMTSVNWFYVCRMHRYQGLNSDQDVCSMSQLEVFLWMKCVWSRWLALWEITLWEKLAISHSELSFCDERGEKFGGLPAWADTDSHWEGRKAHLGLFTKSSDHMNILMTDCMKQTGVRLISLYILLM